MHQWAERESVQRNLDLEIIEERFFVFINFSQPFLKRNKNSELVLK